MKKKSKDLFWSVRKSRLCKMGPIWSLTLRPMFLMKNMFLSKRPATTKKALLRSALALHSWMEFKSPAYKQYTLIEHKVRPFNIKSWTRSSVFSVKNYYIWLSFPKICLQRGANPQNFSFIFTYRAEPKNRESPIFSAHIGKNKPEGFSFSLVS